MLFKSIFLKNLGWQFFFILTTKNTNADTTFFSILWISLILTGNFMPLNSSFLAKCLSIFIILAGFLSTEFKYLTKQHFKDL